MPCNACCAGWRCILAVWMSIGILIGAGAPGLLAAEGEADIEFRYRTLIREGAEFLKQENTDESLARALARFNSALTLKSDSAEARYWIALVYSQMENYGQAAQQAEHAVLLDKRMVEAWLLWGQCLLREGKYEEAVEKLQTAFRLAPRNSLAAFNLGLAHYYMHPRTQKSLRDAHDFFRRALELNPRYNPARLMLGICQLEIGMHTLAIVTLLHVTEEEPDNLDAHFHLGVAYRKENRFDEAEQAFRRVLQLDSLHVESHLQLGHLYLEDKPNRQRAIQHLRLFVHAAPDSHAWKERVVTYLANHDGTPESR